MRYCVLKDLHDVDVIIDEVADLKFATDYRLLLPIEAEPYVVGIQPVRAKNSTVFSHARVLVCIWGPAFEMIHTRPSQIEMISHIASKTLNAPARDALLRRAGYRATICPDSAWVFTRKGSRIGSIKKSFATACQKAGIEDFHIHDLRHTSGAWMIQAGVPLRTVADILRHSSISTTMKYADLSPNNARAGVEALERSDLRSADSQNVSPVVHRSHRFDKK